MLLSCFFSTRREEREESLRTLFVPRWNLALNIGQSKREKSLLLQRSLLLQTEFERRSLLNLLPLYLPAFDPSSAREWAPTCLAEGFPKRRTNEQKD